jgi:DNA polymerase-3 subunit epsilon
MGVWLDRFAALDVEVANRAPVAVCAVGVACFESGRETGHFQSLVQYAGRVRYTRIHGLTGTDLRDAPPWPVVWKDVLRLIEDIRVIVAYRAAFDRGAVMTMCARHALRMPSVRFVCAAKLYREHGGRADNLAAALQACGVPFPGRPHDPLADARAAAKLVRAT